MNSQADKIRLDLKNKWPEAISDSFGERSPVFETGVSELDKLFPQGGIPYGQLCEFSGEESSGKTSLMLKILSKLSLSWRAAYIDFSGCFFPAAASASGVILKNLLIVAPDTLLGGLRTAEKLFTSGVVRTIVLDLIDQVESLPTTIIHRLRQHAARAKGNVFFLTRINSTIIPASMVSLRLVTSRTKHDTIMAEVVRSRICREGAKVEFII